MADQTVNNRTTTFKKSVVKKLKEQGNYNVDDYEMIIRDMCRLYKHYLSTQDAAEEVTGYEDHDTAMKLHRLSLTYYKAVQDSLKILGVTLNQRIARNDTGEQKESTADALARLTSGAK